MRRQAFWTVLAASLGFVALSVILGYAVLQPTTLHVAVGPSGSENHRLMAVLAQLLGREKSDVRLKLVTTEGSATSAAALENGSAELAVLRSDVAAPLDALGVVDLRSEVIVLMAAPGGAIRNINDLRGKAVGIVSAATLNMALMRKLLAYYGTIANDVQLHPIDAENAGSELASGRVAAIMSVGVPTGRVITKLDMRITDALGHRPLYIPITEAPAIAERNPALETGQIVRGVFGGAPPHPPESVATLAVTHRLIASKQVDESVISSLTQQIFALRIALSAEEPSAARIASPDTDRPGALALHPGASAYYEGNVRGFFDRYGDAFYIGIMVLSVCGSGLAALASFANAKRPEPYRQVVDHLLEILGDIRQAGSLAELDRINQRIENVFTTALQHIAMKDFDHQQVATFALTLDQIRHAMSERRRLMAEENRPIALAAQ